MTHPSKRKGNTFEREIVNAATDAGLIAERAYASNGRSLGHTENVDLTINGERIQAKRRAKLATYLQVQDGTDATIIRQDRGQTLVIITLDTYLQKEAELSLLRNHTQ